MSYNRLFEKVSLFYRLAQYGHRSSFIKAVAQTGSEGFKATLNGPDMATPGTPGTPGGRKLTLHEQLSGVIDKPTIPTIPTVNVEDLPKVPAPAPAPFKSIDKSIQDQLNQLLAVSGKMALIDVDGFLGPQTQKALKLFQSTYNMVPTAANIKSVYLKEHNSELETKTPF